MTEQTTERTAPRKRMLSGIKPSGDLTLGSYLGAIRNWRCLLYTSDAADD